MAKSKHNIPPKNPQPPINDMVNGYYKSGRGDLRYYNPNAGTQVGEPEYNLNSVTRYNIDRFLRNQPTPGSQITPGFREMRDFMRWAQTFVNHGEYDRNPFSQLVDNPLMPQLRAGINPYPGTRGYVPPKFLMPPMPSMPPTHPPPSMPPTKPNPGGPTPPRRIQPMPSPLPNVPPSQSSRTSPREVKPPVNQFPRKPTPKQEKPTLDSFVPRYKRN